MDKKILIIVIILTVVVLGFVIGFISPPHVTVCTLKDCGCYNKSEEVPCNYCGASDPIFRTFIINFEKACSARDIVRCENNQYVGRRVDINNCNGPYYWTFFGGTIESYSLFIKRLIYGTNYPYTDIEKISVGSKVAEEN